MTNIVLETVGGICNSKCVWCFMQYKCVNRMSHGMMDYEQFKKFIGLNRNEHYGISPFSHGEALLHPEFIKMCELILASGNSLNHLHTNLAMRLTVSHFKILSEFKEVIVNVGGGRNSTHYDNCGTDLYQVLSNLEGLIRYGVNVYVKIVINHANINEVDILNKRISSYSELIPVTTYPLYFSPSDSDDEDKHTFIMKNLVNPESNKIDKSVECRDNVSFEDGSIVVTPKIKGCYGLIPTIRWNGEVEICCRDRYGEKNVGNAFTTPLKDILKSKEYKKAVKLGKKRKYIKYCEFCS